MSNTAIQIGLAQEAYWMLMNDLEMRDRVLNLVWLSLPIEVKETLQRCIWGLADREFERVRTLMLFVRFEGLAELCHAPNHRHLLKFCDAVLTLTNVRHLQIFGQDVAIAVDLQKGQWVASVLPLPSDWQESKGGL